MPFGGVFYKNGSFRTFILSSNLQNRNTNLVLNKIEIMNVYLKPIKYILLFLVIGVCPGCFEVVEEVTLHSDNSGKILLTFNASRSKEKIKQLMLLDKVDGFPIPDKDEIKAEIRRQKSKLKAQPNISNVQVSEDYNNFIFSVSCDFRNAQSLEEAIISLLQNTKHQSAFDLKTGNFVYKNKTLTRKVHTSKPDQIQKPSEEQKGFLRDATYTSIYRFPAPVYKSTNQNIRLSPDKKAVMFRSSVLDLLENRKSPNLYIKHK